MCPFSYSFSMASYPMGEFDQYLDVLFLYLMLEDANQ